MRNINKSLGWNIQELGNYSSRLTLGLNLVDFFSKGRQLYCLKKQTEKRAKSEATESDGLLKKATKQ